MSPSLGMDFEPIYEGAEIVAWRVSQDGRETVEAPTTVEAYWLARKAPRRG